MEELPVRKRLRLKDYDYSSNGAYFITICTKNRECILSKISVGTDAHIGPVNELSDCGIASEEYIKTIPGIDSYVIMPNHIHLIIILNNGTDNISISSIIRSFKTLVTKRIGKSIWQSKFYDHIIRDYDDYLIRLNYIYENPVKWAFDPYHNSDL